MCTQRCRTHLFSLLALCGVCIVPLFPAGAENDDAWTVDITKQHPPISQENRIIKWCAESGDGVRYASANIELKGYKPCGELKTAMQCDPAGARMINPAGDFPSSYRDCSVGPRIKIERHDPLPLQEPSELGTPSALAANGGLSPDETRRLKREFTAAQEQQERQEQKEMQQTLQAVFGAFGGLPGVEGKRRPSGAMRGKQQDQIQELMKLMMQP